MSNTPHKPFPTNPTLPVQPVQPKPAANYDSILNFVVGGGSGMASTIIIQPVDMVKVRIQVASEQQGKGAKVGPVSVVRDMLSNGKGIKQFYKGLDSALIRQVTYTTTRMGVYKGLFSNYQEKYGEVPFLAKSAFGLTAGFIGSLVGNPADLILIRLQSDATLPEAQRRNYRNFGDAFSRIIKEEGVASLWKGATPTVIRAMALNLGMLGPFDEFKERLNKYYGTKDTLQTRLMASAMAGFLCSFMSLPFDNAKTKMQRMVKGPDGTYPYKNIFDTMGKTVKNEGFAKLWVSFPTFYARIAPHAMLTLLFQDMAWDAIRASRKK